MAGEEVAVLVLCVSFCPSSRKMCSGFTLADGRAFSDGFWSFFLPRILYGWRKESK